MNCARPLAGLQAGLEGLRDGLQPANTGRLVALPDQSCGWAGSCRTWPTCPPPSRPRCPCTRSTPTWPTGLHQAVANLLANAARYCRPGDRVHLRVRVEDGQAVLQVADTGPGIAPDERPRDV